MLDPNPNFAATPTEVIVSTSRSTESKVIISRAAGEVLWVRMEETKDAKEG